MMQDQKVTPAQAYEDYFGPAIFEPLTQVLLEYAPPQLGERVLDLACGTGIVARRVAPMVGAGGLVVGVDINPGMIEVAQAQPAPEGAPIEWRQGDALMLDLPDSAFDVVLLQQGLQFFSDRPAGARRMRRVLADGGRVVLAVWQGLERHPLYEALVDAEVPHLGALGVPVSREEVGAPFSLGDADDLRTLLTDAGFRDIEIASRSIEARFATPGRFVERMEFAYAAVVPQFVEDPAAFAAYLETIGRETKAIVERYREGDWIAVPMHTPHRRRTRLSMLLCDGEQATPDAPPRRRGPHSTSTWVSAEWASGLGGADRGPRAAGLWATSATLSGSSDASCTRASTNPAPARAAGAPRVRACRTNR